MRIIITIFCLLVSLLGRSQTLHLILPARSATCSSTIDVPVKVKNFNGLLSLQGTITWDATRLQFQNISDFGPASLALGSGNFGTNNASAGRVTFSWNDANLSGKTLPDSTVIFSLRFLVPGNSAGNTAIQFTNNPTVIEAINSSFNAVPYQLSNGSIAVTCLPPANLNLFLPRVNVLCNDIFDIPVRAVNFRNLLSLQGSIAWDASSVQFQSMASYGASSLALGAGNFGLNNTGNGKLSFSWNDADLSGENLSDSTVIFSLRFKAVAPSAGSGIIRFVNTPTLLEAIDKSYNAQVVDTTSGQINVSCASPTSLTMILPNITSGCSNVLDVPVKVTYFNGLLSLQGSIGWDPSVLQFQSIVNFGPSSLGLNANSFGLNNTANGRLSFSWNDGDFSGESLSDSTSVFIMRFNVIGAIGRGSLLEFKSTPTVIEAVNLSLNPIACRLINGYASIDCRQVSGSLTMILPSLNVPCSSYVDIPVRARGFYSMVSVQGSMNWDSSRLQFINVIDFGPSKLALNSSNFGTSLINRGKLTIAWNDADLSGETLLDTSVLFTLRFRSIASTAGADSIRFTSDPQPVRVVNTLNSTINCSRVNGAVSPNCLLFTPLVLSMPADSVLRNSTIDIPVKVSGFNNLLSLQGSVNWESAKLQFQSVVNYGPSSLAMSSANFGTTNTSGGKLTFSWNDADLSGETLANGSMIFILRFKAIGLPGTTSVLQFTSSPTALEAINANLTQASLQINNGSVLIKCDTCSTVFNIKAFIQGYYDPGSGSMSSALINSGVAGSNVNQADSIIVELRDSVTGALVVPRVKGIIKTDGTLNVSFQPFTGYAYLVLKHRNSIETWSARPLQIAPTNNYDFSNSISKAYGGNMCFLGAGVYGIWSGDLNQDGIIESEDYAMMENDIVRILFGYDNSDITGDGIVESADYALMENNIPNIIFVQKPF